MKLPLIARPARVAEDSKNDPFHTARMRGQPVLDRMNGNFRRPLLREVENARGDAAEGHGFQPVLQAQIERVAVAVGEVFFQRGRQAVLYDRPDDMDHLFGREIIGVRQHRHGSRLLVIPAIADAQPVHLSVALRAELDSRKAVDAISDPYQNHT